jgi:hypothetical protein
LGGFGDQIFATQKSRPKYVRKNFPGKNYLKKQKIRLDFR